MLKIRTLAAFGAGAAAAYFMDPVHGARRRQAAQAALGGRLAGPATGVRDAARRSGARGSMIGAVVEQAIGSARRKPSSAVSEVSVPATGSPLGSQPEA